ncbi:MAG: hypothetical protein JWP76_3172 [Dactylosporangium sp.]|jgi:hypothetical protein|nr:hypothetical protein [Dactylosporangium sp.]
MRPERITWRSTLVPCGAVSDATLPTRGIRPYRRHVTGAPARPDHPEMTCDRYKYLFCTRVHRDR